MGSVENQVSKNKNEDQTYLFAMQLTVSSVMPMVMQTVIDLNVFEIIAKAGEGAYLSPTEIASHLPTQNPEAPDMLDRMLRLRGNHSVLTCSFVTRENGRVERLYGLAPVCKYFLPNEDGVSLAPAMFWSQDLDNMRGWYRLKDAVLDGGIAFEKVHGMGLFEYNGKNPKFSEVLNRTMYVHTKLIMTKVIEVYNGFAHVKEVIDVGGGIGTASNIICSKYPTIKCINFDLPHVVEIAPPHPGITHVGGDMFDSLPKGETIFLKCTLHDWGDEHCLKILKNCYKALPDNGMVVVVDIILSSEAETETGAKGAAEIDVFIMMQCSGRERTAKEFEALAKEAGFDGFKLVCGVGNYGVMEFTK